MYKYNTFNYYLTELGNRIKNTRVLSKLTQEQLSQNTGVSIRTISRLESGNSIQLESFIKILIALNLDSKIELLVPEQTNRPSVHLKLKQKDNKYLRYKKNAKSDNQSTDFVWGEDK